MAAPVYEVAVIGAGAAGMMAASVAGQRGLRVVLIDHATKLGEKIRISGGGRCNFTNLGTTPANYISKNPHFCRSALSAYTPQDFLRLLKEYGIAWHEKHKGQLFCDDSAEDIIQMLRQECEKGQVSWRMPCAVDAIDQQDNGFAIRSSHGTIAAKQVVIATGGMAIPQLGATDFALKLARQFDLKVIEPRPALVPLQFDGGEWQPFVTLSGMSSPVRLSVPAVAKPRMKFDEDLLFTHRGLSGPGILQISSYWEPGEALAIDLAPDTDMEALLLEAKSGGKQQVGNLLSQHWPKRLVEHWLPAHPQLPEGLLQQRVADVPDKVLRQLAASIHRWELQPSGTAGYKKAEVMRGGVDTAMLDQRSLQVRSVPGLYFIGEAVDVTGWLGGYNFQWAWASGVACGRALQPAA
ncbi:NAD(P)/FAD-dependent oxidoreductase [Paenalcaligenes sp. Me52]|uniref:NAD(P)/FAD-dependent oxidoreductase n=1 Tax=Paenalcaligenes sp. Me52 TaxID=3392038 RepID=UPI003D29B22D